MGNDYKHSMNLPKTDFAMRANLPENEPKRLEKWAEQDIYHRVLEKNKDGEPFVLHDGPPYANGPIHIGHAFNKILKDFVVKSHAQRGYYTPYIPGWDCHGQPIEHEVEKKLGTEKMKQLNVLWKEAGSCGKEKEDALWKEFRSAADDYFSGLKQFNEQRHNDWIKRMQDVRNRKMELIQSQQRQLKWMKNELPTLLSQTAADEMAEDIKDKEEFIQELEADLAEINEKLGVGSKK